MFWIFACDQGCFIFLYFVDSEQAFKYFSHFLWRKFCSFNNTRSSSLNYTGLNFELKYLVDSSMDLSLFSLAIFLAKFWHTSSLWIISYPKSCPYCLLKLGFGFWTFLVKVQTWPQKVLSWYFCDSCDCRQTSMVQCIVPKPMLSFTPRFLEKLQLFYYRLLSEHLFVGGRGFRWLSLFSTVLTMFLLFHCRILFRNQIQSLIIIHVCTIILKAAQSPQLVRFCLELQPALHILKMHQSDRVWDFARWHCLQRSEQVRVD
jgi:hypothetical protein